MAKEPENNMEQEEILFGLVGFPLGHSWSAAYFNEKFRIAGDHGKAYRLFPLESMEEFRELLLEHPSLAGLNVTIPYKEKIIPYLDELDETARSIGAVNTVRITRKNGLIRTRGFNTDAPGFLQTLPDSIPSGPALILGTGGGAKAVAHALTAKKIKYTFVSRNNSGSGIITYDDLTTKLMKDHLLVINATPLGMYPDTENFPPIPYHDLTKDHFLYDLVYNPAVTMFIKQGKAMKAKTMNGSEMLQNQADLSYRIFCI